MKITFLICARGGSKGVPWKNKKSPFKENNIYKRIKDKIESSLSNKYKIIVNTDDDEIERLAKNAGLNVFRRINSLGEASSRIIEVNSQYKIDSGDNFDYLINISPVAPFLRAESIKKTIEIINNLKPPCGGTATKHHNNSHPALAMQKHLVKNKVTYLLNEKKRYPRQARKETFFANGCLFFRAYNMVNGDKESNDLSDTFFPIFLDEIESINIDSIYDWEIAKIIASSKEFDIYH